MAVWGNAAQEAMLSGFITGIGTGVGNGSFRLFNADATPLQLVSANFNSPAFNTPSGSVALLNTTPAVVTGTYTGSNDTIGEYRIYDGDGNLLYDAGTITVSGSGGYNVPTLTIENTFAYELTEGRVRTL